MKKLMLVGAVLAACSSQPAPRSPEAAQSSAQSSAMSGQMEHGMLNCPSAVKNAETVLSMTAGGADLTVTSKDAASQAEIKRLAEMHVHHADAPDAPQHTGMHGGPGTIGHCPVIHDGTQITMDPVPGGVVLHMTAVAPDRVKAVQAQAAERIEALKKDGNIIAR